MSGKIKTVEWKESSPELYERYKDPSKGDHSNTLLQEFCVALYLCLAQQLLKPYPRFVGHRVSCLLIS